MIVAIDNGRIAFSAGPFCDLRHSGTVVDIYVGF